MGSPDRKEKGEGYVGGNGKGGQEEARSPGGAAFSTQLPLFPCDQPGHSSHQVLSLQEFSELAPGSRHPEAEGEHAFPRSHGLTRGPTGLHSAPLSSAPCKLTPAIHFLQETQREPIRSDLRAPKPALAEQMLLLFGEAVRILPQSLNVRACVGARLMCSARLLS